MKSVLRFTILLSLLLHLLVFTPWFLNDSTLAPEVKPKNQTVEFTLQPTVTPPKPGPKPEPDIPPPPRHLEDDITKSNTSNVKAWHSDWNTHEINPKFQPILDRTLNAVNFINKNFFGEKDFYPSISTMWAMMYDDNN